MFKILLMAFFFSGFSSLVYEVLWSRILTVMFGASIYGQSIVLALFMGGMALGAAALPKASCLRKHPVISFIVLEIVILLSGFSIPYLREISLFLEGENLSYFSASLLTAVLFILPATIAMGGTFPVILKIINEGKNAAKLSQLYSLNTLGGLTGVLLASYYLLQNFGVSGALVTAILANISALCAGLLILKFKLNIQDKSLKIANKSSVDYKAGAALFISGFLTMAYELSWSRALSFSYGSSTYTFSIILASFLGGISLGAYCFKKIERKPGKDFLMLYKDLQVWSVIGACLFGFITVRMPLISSFFYTYTYKSFIIRQAGEFLAVFIFALPVSFCSGLAFPLLCKVYAKDNDVKNSLGMALFFNTMGSVCGSIIAGFVLIDWIGPFKTVWIYIALHITALLCLKKKQSVLLHFAVIIIALTFYFYQERKVSSIDLLSGGYARTYVKDSYIPEYLRNSEAYMLSRYKAKSLKADPYKLDSIKYGKTSAIALMKNNISKSLVIDGKVDASCGSFFSSDMPTQSFLGFLPVIFSKKRDTSLVIGLGSGVTAGVLTDYVNKTYAVEIEKEVVNSLGYFSEFNNNISVKDNIEIIIKDARHYIRNTKLKYDIISSEPSNIWIGGVSHLFTKEYFENCRRVLSDEGVMIQWLHVYKLSLEDFKIALKTFLSVFPDTQIWGSINLGDIFFIAKKNNDFTIMETEFKNLLNKLSCSDDLNSIGVKDLKDFSQFRISADSAKYQKNLKEVKIHSDDFPILEFSAAKNMFRMNIKDIFNFLEKE